MGSVWCHCSGDGRMGEGQRGDKGGTWGGGTNLPPTHTPMWGWMMKRWGRQQLCCAGGALGELAVLGWRHGCEHRDTVPPWPAGHSATSTRTHHHHSHHHQGHITATATSSRASSPPWPRAPGMPSPHPPPPAAFGTLSWGREPHCSSVSPLGAYWCQQGCGAGGQPWGHKGNKRCPSGTSAPLGRPPAAHSSQALCDRGVPAGG